MFPELHLALSAKRYKVCTELNRPVCSVSQARGKSALRPTPWPSAGLPSLQSVPQIHSQPQKKARRHPSWLRPLVATPPQSQIQVSRRPNLSSRAPDGMDVRVELLHSGSQELEEPLGEEVAACGPRHRGSSAGHSGGPSPCHHKLHSRPEPAARVAGN